jgi:hypothetical protein
MRTPEQVKWDFVQQWLTRAHKDLVAGEVLLKEGLKITKTLDFTHSKRGKIYQSVPCSPSD